MEKMVKRLQFQHDRGWGFCKLIGFHFQTVPLPKFDIVSVR